MIVDKCIDHMVEQKSHGKNLRKGRYSEENRIYVVTTVTVERKPIFLEFAAARALINVLQKHEELGFANTLCFVVMPGHLHWMMQLGTLHDLSDTMQVLKSITTRKLGKTVFQKGFYDHAVRREEDIKNLARYMVANPLRAGLVNNINDYPHWDAVWM